MIDLSSKNSILQLKENIQLLETHIIQIEFLSSKIGGLNDCGQLRDELLNWQQRAKQLVSNAQENFKNLQSNTAENRVQKEKAAEDLIRSVDRLKNLVQISLLKEKEYSCDQLGGHSLVSNFLFQNSQDFAINSNNLNEIKSVRDSNSQFFQMESDINFLNRIIRDISLIAQENDSIIEKIQIKTEQNLNPSSEANRLHLVESEDAGIKKLKEKVTFFIAIFITLSIFSLILLAILV